jgi:hypothetical protein
LDGLLDREVEGDIDSGLSEKAGFQRKRETALENGSP